MGGSVLPAAQSEVAGVRRTLIVLILTVLHVATGVLLVAYSYDAGDEVGMGLGILVVLLWFIRFGYVVGTRNHNGYEDYE